jgi:hypothetical protein
MKVKPDQLERFANLLIKHYRDKDLMVAKVDDTVLKKQIIDIVAANFAEEEAIEEEARKMLASLPQGPRDVDPFKMFLLAKQKLAAKKGFIL